MNYVEKPNLPKNNVNLVAISAQAGESIAKLNAKGIKTINIVSDYNLPEPISSHADIRILHLENNTIFCQNKHLCAGDFNQNFKLVKIKEKAGKKYPQDARLNCTLIGNKIICNKHTLASEILEYADTNGLNVIHVNQGYARCSICVVNENAIITDDKSIYTAAAKFFDDAQLISKGSIGLNGYGYGFIGGCCGKIAKDKLAFNGAIESHSDYKLIIDFLGRNSVECVELHNNPLYDIGGILPLCEDL